MDPRLHAALDDESGTDSLPPELALELEEVRAILAGTVRAVPAAPLPDLGAAVLRRLDTATRPRALTLAAPPERTRGRIRFVEWIWSPRQLSMSFRPAYALAAAAVVAVMLAIGTAASPRDPQVAAAPGEVLVRFQLEAPQAQSVTLAGAFSDWAPAHAMQRSADGVWTIVVPLRPGVHEYAYVVDGSRWIADPAAPAQPDGFGGMNSRISVLRPDARS